MARAGVEEVAVQDGLYSVYVNHLELYGPLAVFLLEDLRRVRAVRCQEVPYSRGGLQAQVIGKGYDASASIAAHHAAAAVGVEEFHGKVIAGGLPQNHKAVGVVLLTKGQNLFRLPVGVYSALPTVQHHKVVPCSGELVQRNAQQTCEKLDPRFHLGLFDEGEIEPHGVAVTAVLEEERAGYVGNAGGQCAVIQRYGVHAFRQGEPQEQSPLGVRPANALRHILFKQGNHLVPSPSIHCHASLQIPVQGTAGEELGGQVLVKNRRAQVQALLAHVNLFQQFFRAYNPSQPEPRCKDLGETAQLQCALRGQFADGRDGLSLVAKLAVGTVLHNEAVQFAGHFHQFLPFLQGHGFAGRVVEVRDDVDEFDLRFFDSLRSLRMTGLHGGAVGAEALEGTEVHGVIGQNDVSGVHEDAGAHVNALLGRGGNLYLRHRDAVAGGDGFPQFGYALRGAVLQRFCAVLFQHGGGEAGDFVYRERVGGGVSSGERADGAKVHLPENLPYRGT